MTTTTEPTTINGTKGDATAEQFEKVHRTVMATSPNYFNLATAIPLTSRLVVE